MAENQSVKLRLVTDYLCRCVYKRYIMDMEYEMKPPEVDEPEEDMSSYFSNNIPTMVYYFGSSLRSLFGRVFQSISKSPFTNHLYFVLYLLTNCRKLVTYEFEHLVEKIGHQKMPFFRFLLSCAFIAEVVRFCMRKMCYKYLKMSCKCMRMVFNRHLKESFEEVGGWEGLMEYCDDQLPIFKSLPHTLCRRFMGLPRAGREEKEIRTSIKLCEEKPINVEELCLENIVMPNDMTEEELQIVYDCAEETERSKPIFECSVCESDCSVCFRAFMTAASN